MLAPVSSLWQPAAVGVVRRFGDHMNRMVLAAAFLTSTSSLAFSSFRSEVPNGASNSCQTCHTRAGGGSPWNSFGNALITSNGGEADNSGSVDAFAAAFIWWDQSLCNADSDGDGQSNGQELGDPDCIWTGGAAARSTDIGSPGDSSVQSADPDGANSGDGGGGDPDAGGDGPAGDAPGGCSASPSSLTPFGVAALVLMLRRRRRAP